MERFSNNKYYIYFDKPIKQTRRQIRTKYRWGWLDEIFYSVGSQVRSEVTGYMLIHRLFIIARLNNAPRARDLFSLRIVGTLKKETAATSKLCCKIRRPYLLSGYFLLPITVIYISMLFTVVVGHSIPGLAVSGFITIYGIIFFVIWLTTKHYEDHERQILEKCISSLQELSSLSSPQT